MSNETGSHNTARYAVDAERKRQDAKWGVQDHDHFMWYVILGEEFGELAEAMLDLHTAIAEGADIAVVQGRMHHVEEELVQVTAVGLSWLENLHRRKERQQAEEAAQR